MIDMDEVYVCSVCGHESSEEKDFKTDIDCGQEKDDFLCEACYDRMDGEMMD